jgi:hypothetical protein
VEDNQHNPFDNIGIDIDPEKIKKHQHAQNALNEKLDILIHRTFAQSEAGIELLDLWKESLMITPGLQPGMCDKEAGIIEGKKSFIRNIILTIRRVNKNE